MNLKAENCLTDDGNNDNKNSSKDESNSVDENEEINQKDDETNEIEEEALEMKPNQEECTPTNQEECTPGNQEECTPSNQKECIATIDDENDPAEDIQKEDLDKISPKKGVNLKPVEDTANFSTELDDEFAETENQDEKSSNSNEENFSSQISQNIINKDTEDSSNEEVDKDDINTEENLSNENKAKDDKMETETSEAESNKDGAEEMEEIEENTLESSESSKDKQENNKDTSAEENNSPDDMSAAVIDDVVDIENAEFEIVDDSTPMISQRVVSEDNVATVKLELVQNNMKEEILAEDDNNIVGIISGMEDLHDSLEEDLGPPAPIVDVKVKIEEINRPIFTTQWDKKKSLKRKKYEEIVIDMDTAFTDQEDMALHALDLLSPYDLHFISSHLSKRTKLEIEKRLDDNVFRKKHFLYQKIPSFLFCMQFYNSKMLKFRALVNITEKMLSLLICVNKKCVHGEDIPEVNVEYMGSFKFGIDLNILVEFINENISDRWRGQLFMTTEKLEEIMISSKLSFHKYGTSIGHVYSKTSKPRVQHKLKKKENPMKVVKGGRLQTDPEHDATIVKIVSAVGQRWDTVLNIMNETFGKIKAQGKTWTNEKLEKVIKDHYLCYLDDRKTEPFTPDEDKCLLFLHKFYFQQWTHAGFEEQRWKQVARHMEGRTMDDCRERLKRKSTSKDELSLDNLDLGDIHDDIPSLFYHNESHIFGLTVIPNDEKLHSLDVPTRLQMEARFLIAGTVDGVYVLPCKESAMRCVHQGMHTMQFTHNPAKPDSQFETFLKLTFANELKRVSLIDDVTSETFNFNQIQYCAKGIHEIMDRIDKNRFILPREHFMNVNEKEDMKCNGGKRGFTTEAYYLEDF